MKKFIIVILVLAVCAVAVNSESTDSLSEAQTSDISSEGGNTGSPEMFALEITISEDKYFVDNHEIGFEELKTKIDALEKGSTVKVNDENSTLKAFNAVKNQVEMLGFSL